MWCYVLSQYRLRGDSITDEWSKPDFVYEILVQWSEAPFQRVSNQWVSWGDRFNSNQFKTTFYPLTIMECHLCLLALGEGRWRMKLCLCTKNIGCFVPGQSVPWTMRPFDDESGSVWYRWSWISLALSCFVLSPLPRLGVKADFGIGLSYLHGELVWQPDPIASFIPPIGSVC